MITENEDLIRKRDIADLQAIMAMVEGRRLVWRLLEESKIFHLSFVIGDSGLTAFNEGARSTGLRLLDDVKTHCRQEYLTMQQEALSDEYRRRRHDNDNDDQY